MSDPLDTPQVVGSYPGGPTRGTTGGTSQFRGVREREGARAKMLQREAKVEMRLRYAVAAVIGIAIAVWASGTLSKSFEASATPEVAEKSFEELLKSERKHILGELWKMERLEAIR